MMNKGYTLMPSYIQYLAYFTFQSSTSNFRVNRLISLIENCFSLEHLNKDIFIRSVIDKTDGWLPISVLMCYNSVKRMRFDKEQIENIVTNMMMKSMEITKEKEEVYIRRKEWNDVKSKLMDVRMMKGSRVNYVQNEYMVNRIAPKKGMRAMRSVLDRNK